MVCCTTRLTRAEEHPAKKGVLPILADRAHHVDAPVHLPHQVGNLLRRVLQIGVEGDDDLPPALFQAGEDRGVLAVVAVEQHADDLGLTVGGLGDHPAEPSRCRRPPG